MVSDRQISAVINNARFKPVFRVGAIRSTDFAPRFQWLGRIVQDLQPEWSKQLQVNFSECKIMRGNTYADIGGSPIKPSLVITVPGLNICVLASSLWLARV